jgi:hypothetical protein
MVKENSEQTASERRRPDAAVTCDRQSHRMYGRITHLGEMPGFRPGNAGDNGRWGR